MVKVEGGEPRLFSLPSAPRRKGPSSEARSSAVSHAGQRATSIQA